MNRLQSSAFMCFAAMLGFTLSTCETLSKATENIALAEGHSLVMTSLFSALNAAEEVNQLNGSRPSGPIGIANENVILIYTDSLLTDGNGIAYILDFEPLNSQAPKGIQCGDGIYRTGKIRVTIGGDWSESNTQFSMVLDSFSTGDGISMKQVNGTIRGYRKSSKSWEIDFTDLKIKPNNSNTAHELSGICEVVTTSGDQTIGLLDNIQDVFGSGSGKLQSGESYGWSIDQNIPLTKRMENGCAETFVKGVVKMINSNEANLQLDFDPFENQACDRVAKALLGRREFIFTIE
jgi:hypothetical protein